MAAPASLRPAGSTKRMGSMRPTLARPGPHRANTATPTLTGRASPADSLTSSRTRTPKRKAQHPIESAPEVGEETNINVVVRCRGRNDRELRENSGVVVSTDSIKGSKVDLSMGPSALSNKTYQFDKVFSPAADQGMLFDEVVLPILDEVLSGFNCTIFAYGQTGTGKTYTMSGDISDVVPVPDAAGIIPRVLHTLFDKLDGAESEKAEHSVKCSFIELYNEELRDLLSAEDGAKLKIFDETNKNGRSTTLVQGMEESHIKDAFKGIQLLREGSHKRQVAATKCNDLSSRSHTVFTITVYVKRTTDSGEDVVSSGKLNLVDLAGSENIQRSGAENKRAAEAGLINKSLLTLGRVINALVDKSSHIPYRESKLTRLLQDSLGGRTKTCIIATLSPAKSNLEETISTLDYAFRAKNIRNKPQVNQMLSKKTLLREFTAEIEKLKSELIATRQRNGVYLTTQTYEELTTESESRRILSEEQRDKIETMEMNLRNKVQELFVLTTNFSSLRRDNEQTQSMLEGTKSVLEKTELILAHTRHNLADETTVRKAHQETEEKLSEVGQDLLGTLETTTDHVDRLHSKLRRRSDLQALNRTRWVASQASVCHATTELENRMEGLCEEQERLVAAMSNRMKGFVSDEMRELQSSRVLLQEKATAFEVSQAEVDAQTAKAKDEMNIVLEEIITLREDVKQRVGSGLDDLSTAGRRISAGIATELSEFHSQLQDVFVSLGREFKTLFGDLIDQMAGQRAEADRLRQEMEQANTKHLQAVQEDRDQLQQGIEAERELASVERVNLLASISDLINQSAAVQEGRIHDQVETSNKRLKTSADEYRVAHGIYAGGMHKWDADAQSLIDTSIGSRDAIKSQLQNHWKQANGRTAELLETATTVHGETVRIVDVQKAQMDSQLVALDDILCRVRSQNEQHHAAHASSLSELADNVQESYKGIVRHFETTYDRTEALDHDMDEHSSALRETLASLSSDGTVLLPIQQLRDDAQAARIEEYEKTGETPAKMQYRYPTVLPRTKGRETLLSRIGGDGESTTREASPLKSPRKRSPAKGRTGSPVEGLSSPSKTTTVFKDVPPTLILPPIASAPLTRAHTDTSALSLRELDANVSTTTTTASPEDDEKENQLSAPSLRRTRTNPFSQSQTEHSKGFDRRKMRSTAAAQADGRENIPPSANVNLSASVGYGGGRRLRSRGSD